MNLRISRGIPEGFLETELPFENGLELAENKRKNQMMAMKEKAETGVRTAVQAERTACSKACRCEIACCVWGCKLRLWR